MKTGTIQKTAIASVLSLAGLFGLTSTASATAIGPGAGLNAPDYIGNWSGTIFGITDNEGDDVFTIDRFDFEATAGSTWNFNIETTDAGFAGLDTYLLLVDSANNVIDDGVLSNDEDFANNIFDSLLNFTFTTTGSYTLYIGDVNGVDFSGFTAAEGLAGQSSTNSAYDIPTNAQEDYWLAVEHDDPGSNTVPEPATLLLMGLGIAGIGLSRKKKSV